jgi:hypothetical protein
MSFMHKLVDWRAFESFVTELYRSDPNLVVEHDVTETGKSGAKRQTDVKITHQVLMHKYVTLVECKRWKEKIDRSRIDVLASSVEDLGASKGVMFTTSGYEEGAVQYAKAKGIDIFVVRDLTAEEWGLPGPEIFFYLHFISSKVDMHIGECSMTPLVRKYPSTVHLDIKVEKDKQPDESLSLFSVDDGRRGPNLESLILEKQSEVAKKVGHAVPLLDQGKDGAAILVETEVRLAFENYDFRQLRFPYGAVELKTVVLKLTTRVDQSVFRFDRTQQYESALLVENFIESQRTIVSKTKDETASTVIASLLKRGDTREEVLANGSVMKIAFAPWVGLEIEGGEKRGTTPPLVISLAEPASGTPPTGP